MGTNDRYITLVREFEQKLYRKLTIKEKNFIKWMVKKEHFKLEDSKEAPNKIINIEQWYRKKNDLPFL